MNIPFSNNSNGMSLIEVIVSLTILSVVFIGLVTIYPFGLSITGSAEKETVSSFLAQRKLEQLRKQGYKNIGTGIIEEKHRLSSEETDHRYDYQRRTEASYMDSSLSETGSDTGLKKITTTVYYVNDVSKKEDQYQITTLLSE